MSEHLIGIFIDGLSVLGSFIGLHTTPTFHKSFKFYLFCLIGFLWLLSGDLDMIEGKVDFIFSEQPLRSLVFRGLLTVGIWAAVIGTKCNNGCGPTIK